MKNYNAIIERLEKVYREKGKVTIVEFESITGIKFCRSHSGKMRYMFSLSTANWKNPICVERMKNNDSICANCYVNSIAETYGENFIRVYETNTDILTNIVIPAYLWPTFNRDDFRIEAFGDCQNEIQAENYLNFTKQNSGLIVGLWTKNYGFYHRVIERIGKPENLILLVSSIYVNVQLKIENFKYADKVFTVYTAQYALDNNVPIVCGKSKCKQCHICYSHSNIKYVNEVIKAEQPYYYKELAKRNNH